MQRHHAEVRVLKPRRQNRRLFSARKTCGQLASHSSIDNYCRWSHYSNPVLQPPNQSVLVNYYFCFEPAKVAKHDQEASVRRGFVQIKRSSHLSRLKSCWIVVKDVARLIGAMRKCPHMNSSWRTSGCGGGSVIGEQIKTP